MSEELRPCQYCGRTPTSWAPAPSPSSGLSEAWLRTVEARHAETESFLLSRGKEAPECHRDRGALLATVRRLLSQPSESQAVADVVEAAQSVADAGALLATHYPARVGDLRRALARLSAIRNGGDRG